MLYLTKAIPFFFILCLSPIAAARIEFLEAKEYGQATAPSVQQGAVLPSINDIFYDGEKLNSEIQSDLFDPSEEILSFTLPANKQEDILLPINFRFPITPLVNSDKPYKELFAGDYFEKIDTDVNAEFYLCLFRLFMNSDGRMELKMITNADPISQFLIYMSFLEKRPSILSLNVRSEDPIIKCLSDPAVQSFIFREALKKAFDDEDFSAIDKGVLNYVGENKRLFSRLFMEDHLWLILLLRYGKEFLFQRLDSFGCSPGAIDDYTICSTDLTVEEKCERFLDDYSKRPFTLKTLRRLANLYSRGLIEESSVELWSIAFRKTLFDLMKKDDNPRSALDPKELLELLQGEDLSQTPTMSNEQKYEYLERLLRRNTGFLTTGNEMPEIGKIVQAILASDRRNKVATFKGIAKYIRDQMEANRDQMSEETLNSFNNLISQLMNLHNYSHNSLAAYDGASGSNSSGA